MAENKLPFAEGASINRPPMFSGVNYQFWKVRMKVFIESIDHGIWNVIVNGPFIPMHVVDGVHVAKPFDELSDLENKKMQYDCVAKNIITSALNLDEFFRVSQCSSAKEMWDILEVTHEGTMDVKRAHKHAFIQEYELFRMQPRETIADVQKRFTHIVNHLIGLGKQLDKEELNIKILRCLDRSWQPKVMEISETRDLTTLKTAALFGKLREHELEMIRLKEMETVEKKTKSLTLKTRTAIQESTDESSGDCSESENLNLLTRKFQKFIKMKSKLKNQQGKRGKNKPDSGSTKFVCFGCGKQGHMKVECPSIATKDKALEKKNNKYGKTRRAYIAWEDNATSSCCSLEEEIEVNLCLMARRDYEVSSIESSASFNSTNYITLLHAFQETHEEANKLALSNSRLKGTNK